MGTKPDPKNPKNPDMIEVKRLVDDKVKLFKEEQVEPRNPPKYELLEDMANMTYLSEGSIVHCLHTRYELFLIYTYSGLFCVTINPYKMLPVYENYVVLCYNQKRRTEMPPHVYSVSDNAYQVIFVINFRKLNFFENDFFYNFKQFKRLVSLKFKQITSSLKFSLSELKIIIMFVFLCFLEVKLVFPQQ
jgi:hypothetical protein